MDWLPISVSWGTLQLLAISFLALYLVNIFVTRQRLLKSINYHPGWRVIFPTFGIWNILMPEIRGVNLGRRWSIDYLHKPFAKAGVDVLSLLHMFPKPEVSFVLADPVTIKEVTTYHSRFWKPVELYINLSFFGPNIIASEGHEWKKHRKLSAPAFSERNNGLVWDETVRIALEMIQSWEEKGMSVIAVDHVADITIRTTLMVISSAAFGYRMSATEETNIPSGHAMTFTTALRTLADNTLTRITIPKWVGKFSNKVRLVHQASEEFEIYAQEMIDERREFPSKTERYDLLSALLDGSENEAEADRLTNEEIIANIFMFIVAGHETGAHTLAFTFGFLALEQDHQEKLYQQITSVLPKDTTPGYEYMNAVPLALATLYEVLRFFPSVSVVPKVSTEDTTLPFVQPDRSVGRIPIPKGTYLLLNAPSLHRNPRYWKDPEAFEPTRFLGEYPKDAFIPFSVGPRACLGRRFFETEGVAFLIIVLSRYQVCLRNPEEYQRLTSVQKRDKLLASTSILTQAPVRLPLVFKKRV